MGATEGMTLVQSGLLFLDLGVIATCSLVSMYVLIRIYYKMK